MSADIDVVLKQIIVTTAKQGLDVELSPDEINEDTDLIYDLGFHSIVSIRFIAAVEDVFGIEIDDDELDNELLGEYRKLKEYIKIHINDK